MKNKIFFKSSIQEMNLRKKQNIILIGILIFILISASFIIAEEQVQLGKEKEVAYLDVGRLMLLKDREINGRGIDYSKTTEFGKDVNKITFEESNAKLNFNGNIFENITQGKNNYIELDKDGNISKMNLKINGNGSEIVLEGKKIKLPPNSEVRYDKEKGLEIKVPDNGKLEKLPEKTEGNFQDYPVKILGNNVELPNGKILKEGILTLKNKDLFVEKGNEAIINYVKFLKTDNDVALCFDEKCKNEKENYFYLSDKEIDLHSVENGKVKTEMLPGNEFFDMKKMLYDKKEYQFVKFNPGDDKQGWLKDENGYRYKNINDERSKLNIVVTEGDDIEFIKREESGLIPKVIHTSSEKGISAIENGRVALILDKDRIWNAPPKKLSFDWSDKQNSIALDIESNSKNNIRMSSSNRYIISEDEIPRVAYNKEGLMLGESIDENEMKTLDQLKLKYPSIDFDIPKKNMAGKANQLKEVSPDIVQIIGQAISENPEMLGRTAMIYFTDDFNGYSSWNKEFSSNELCFGAKLLDVYNPDRVRENNPLSSISHEDEHSQDNIIRYFKEERKINKLFPEDFKKIDELESKREKYFEIDDPDVPGTMKYKSEITTEEFEELHSLDTQIEDIKKNIDKNLDKNSEIRPLQNFYNDIAQDCSNNLLENNKGELNDMRKEIINEAIKNTKEKYGIELRPEDFYKGDINKRFVEKYGSTYWSRDVTLFNMLLERIPVTDKYGPEELSNINNNLNYFGLKDSANNIKKLIEKSGVPDVYAYFNYGNSFFSGKTKEKYFEVSSTYREEPISLRQQKANSENPYVRDTYQKLTQLAFDSGKMKADEYKQIMGEDYCEEDDCCDKKCVMYKLTCEPC